MRAPFLALASLLLLLPPPPAYAAPGTVSPDRLTLRVDTRALGEPDGPRLQAALERALTEHLRERGLSLDPGDEVPVLIARVERADVGYRLHLISLELVVAGEREALVKNWKCVTCSEQEVIEQTLALLEASSLESRQARPCKDAQLDEQTPAPAPVPPPPSPRLDIGPLGIVGVMLLAGGAAAGGVAGAMYTAPFAVGEYANRPEDVSFGLLIAGGASLGLGLATLIVDQTALRKHRARRESAAWGRPSVSADLSPTRFGLRIEGSF